MLFADVIESSFITSLLVFVPKKAVLTLIDSQHYFGLRICGRLENEVWEVKEEKTTVRTTPEEDCGYSATSGTP
jgi:hypothetical protein